MVRIISMLCLAIVIGLPTTASFGRGSGGSHHSSMTGGAAGTPASAPGTNSLGTALSSSGVSNPMRGSNLDNNPAVARQDATVDRLVKGSICRGC
jgi:hypothetical protein